MSKNPAYTPYKHFDEVLELKSQFFAFAPEKDERLLAINKVKALMTKGRLPHAIECTSLLTSAVMNDPYFSGKGATDSSLLKLTYTMTLIRFVNGLLDPFQQSTHAIPLHTLAKNLNLPTWFVELRHQGTHESLPSLNMLRMGAKEALNWLWHNYWLPLDEDNQRGVSVEEEEIDDMSPRMVQRRSEMKELLREYRRIKRENLSRVFKFGDSTETGTKYWKAVNKLLKLYNKDDSGQFFKVLLFKNVIIITGKTMKFAQLKALYSPLFEYFNKQSPVDEVSGEVDESFYEAFMISLLEGVNDYYGRAGESVMDRSETLYHQSESEVSQALEWIKFLMIAHNAPKQANRIASRHLYVPIESTLYKLRECGNISNAIKLELLQTILAFSKSVPKGSSNKFTNEAVSKDEVEEIERYIEFMGRFSGHEELMEGKSEEAEVKREASPVDDITSDLAQLKKRMRLAMEESRAAAEEEASQKKAQSGRRSVTTNSVKAFEKVDSWFAYAFGEEYD